jgi:hypothetical protein
MSYLILFSNLPVFKCANRKSLWLPDLSNISVTPDSRYYR